MTDTPEDQPQSIIAASLMRSMADKIDLNAANGFAGAVIIVPPVGKPVSSLYLDDSADQSLFWGSLKSRIDMALLEIQEEERNSGVFGSRR